MTFQVPICFNCFMFSYRECHHRGRSVEDTFALLPPRTSPHWLCCAVVAGPPSTFHLTCCTVVYNEGQRSGRLCPASFPTSIEVLLRSGWEGSFCDCFLCLGVDVCELIIVGSKSCTTQVQFEFIAVSLISSCGRLRQTISFSKLSCSSPLPLFMALRSRYHRVSHQWAQNQECNSYYLVGTKTPIIVGE